ncbi:hypothetical protein [Planomicrobium okeanokoites]|uniref:hypothetical protein n=1 Tax=Planomicrobium okeanokoites TaxID=244 RepID=UPI0009FF61E8|nr:hypothetical protein [Planomicrobium okeanokoites]
MKKNDTNTGQEKLKKVLSKEELQPYIEMLKPHKEFLTSAREWNAYRKDLGLPHSQTLIGKFGSWNAVKESFEDVEVNARHRPIKYDKAKVKAILKEHGEHLTSQAAWNQYANENKLPNYTILFDRLTDEEIYEITKYRRVYTKDIISQIVKEYYPTTPPSFREWNYLAKNETGIPSASLIIVRFGSWKRMIKEVYE